MDQSKALLSAVKLLKSKGVTALKIELEANLERSTDEEGCLSYLIGRIEELTRTQRNPHMFIDYDHDESAVVIEPFTWMKYACFYNDHSVDSELTFTVPLTAENLQYLPLVVQAFKDLGTNPEYSSEFDVSGAGMHMAFLFSEDFSYPGDHSSYDPAILRNFKKSMNQLMPALFFLGSVDKISRPIGYRIPGVSTSYESLSDKYKAITYRQGALEFRVFDTCYQSPSRILDNIVVMSNCMKYFSSTYRSPGLNKLASRINFGVDANDNLDRFYQQEVHLDFLNGGLRRLKPDYYTIKDIKQQRAFTRTKRCVKKQLSEQEVQARNEYTEYIERFQWECACRQLNRESLYVEKYINNALPTELSSLTIEDIQLAVRPSVEADMQSYRQRYYKTKQSYIKNRLKQFRDEAAGEYLLTFS